MECELWPQLYILVIKEGKGLRRKKVHYSDTVIVLVFLWGCLHDRPQCWACDPDNWRATRLKPVHLPSGSTLSRRLESPSVKRFMKQLEHDVRCSENSGLIKFIDAKPLPVGACTKDPEAKPGRAVGGMARGYKLYAIWGNRSLPESWSVQPLNKSEISVAKTLIPQITGTGYLVGDGLYDVVLLHDLSQEHNHQLVSRKHYPRAKGLGHVRQSVHRKHALEMIQRPFGLALLTQREAIERLFANVTSFSGGLSPLPAWVRRLHRVTRWVWAKLIINAARIRFRKGLAA